MGLFTPKSKKEMAMDAAAAAVASEGLRRAVKVVGGAVAGLVTVTAASAAISASRGQESS